MISAEIKKWMPQYGTNVGHGHVWSRPDREKEQCGGPELCLQCNKWAKRLERVLKI